MTLLKLKDYDPNYRDTFEGEDLEGKSVYSEVNNDKIGTVDEVLVDEDGHFRYLVVDLGFWIFGKKILLPIGRSRLDYDADRVYAVGLSREQAEALPEFKNLETADYEYEEEVRGVYRSPSAGYAATDDITGMTAAPMSADYTATAPNAISDSAAYTPNPINPEPTNMAYDRNNYTYDREPHLYGIDEQNHRNLKLYEERLIANKNRMKAGEVAIGKRIETETAKATVPVEKERVIIERNAPPFEGSTQVAPGETDFDNPEAIRMEVYEETARFNKEAYVREEVNVRKEVERDVAEAQETVRREELEVDVDGNAILDDRRNSL